MNGTAKEPLRCVVISFSFDFIRWYSISMSSETVELSRVRFPAKLSRVVSVSRKQSKQARSIGGLVWLVIKTVIEQKERALLQWSLTLDVILIILITKETPKFSEIQFDLKIVSISPIHFFQLIVFLPSWEGGKYLKSLKSRTRSCEKFHYINTKFWKSLRFVRNWNRQGLEILKLRQMPSAWVVLGIQWSPTLKKGDFLS